MKSLSLYIVVIIVIGMCIYPSCKKGHIPTENSSTPKQYQIAGIDEAERNALENRIRDFINDYGSFATCHDLQSISSFLNMFSGEGKIVIDYSNAISKVKIDPVDYVKKLTNVSAEGLDFKINNYALADLSIDQDYNYLTELNFQKELAFAIKNKRKVRKRRLINLQAEVLFDRYESDSYYINSISIIQ